MQTSRFLDHLRANFRIAHNARRIAAVLPLVAVVSLSPFIVAQTPSRPGKVFLTGENPWIFLNDKPDGVALTQVSFWRIHWSPVGPGHVCFVTIGEDKSHGAGAVRVALYDNRNLLDYLTNEVLGTYNKSYIERPFTPVGGATFAAGGDSINERRETCKTDKYDIELVWRDLHAPGLVDILPGTRPTNPFGITYLRMPAGSAEVHINGKPAPGASVPAESFLAFGETWIK
jgi:hypothetical protein